MTPIFPLTTPPTCRRCGHPSVHDIVKPENPNGNAGRPYFRCMDGCHPQSSEFVSWDDYEGIEAGNPPCWCPDKFTSRRDKTNREPRKYFYKCPLGRCKFWAWDGEVEAYDGSGYGYGGGGGSGIPVSAGNGVYVKVEETQDDWSAAAGPSRPAMYPRPGFDTHTDHDSAYGSQAAGPSAQAPLPASTWNSIDEIDYYATGPSQPTTHARPQMNHDSTYSSQAAGPSMQAALPASARNRIDEIDYATGPSQPRPDISRQIKTQRYHGETVLSTSGPGADRQMEETRHNGVEGGAASFNGHAMYPQPNQSLQRQTEVEETPVTNGVTAGAPVFIPIAEKNAEISMSSMEDAFGRKFGAPRRRRCCGICAVM